jgi:polyphosphate kinase
LTPPPLPLRGSPPRGGAALARRRSRTRGACGWGRAAQVRPLLMPVRLDPSHPFPLVANKSLNFIVRLGGKDAFGRANEIAIVKVPRVLPRLIRMPDAVSEGRTQGSSRCRA